MTITTGEKTVVIDGEELIVDPPISEMETDEAVRFLIETYGRDEYDAYQMVLIAKGERPVSE